MAQEVILPRQGQSVETCLILAWKKKVGDPVEEGEVLVEVETDKAAFEVESTASGTLLHVFHREGEDVPVLAPLALVGQQGEDISAQVRELSGGGGAEAAAVAPETAGPAEAAPEAAGPAAAPAPEAAAPRGVPQAAAAPGRPGEAPSGPGPAGRRVAISPRARRLAETNALSPEQVAAALEGGAGSGPLGRILERDVEAMLASGRAPPAAARPAAAPTDFPGPTRETPVRGIRKLIAERMLASLQGTAQYTLHASASAEAMLAYRRQLKASPEEWALREVTINDLVNYVAVRVLLRHPEVNSHFLGDRIVSFERVHLGVAVDTPRGLMVPVVRNAGSLSLRQLAAEVARLRSACLENKVNPDELSGGTFTVSNLGSFGVESFTPVLNPPQAAILGVSTIQLKPVKGEEDEVAFRRCLGLSLTANHQVVDGAPGARFLREVCEAVENFDLLLAG